MRITIDTEDGDQAQKAAAQPEQAEPESVGEPPAELAARAEAMGASSAGPAPAEMAAEEPSTFLAEPVAPETAPQTATGSEDMSAGGAPEFAAGEIESEERKPEAEEAETETEDQG